jgi:hypothetical protein
VESIVVVVSTGIKGFPAKQFSQLYSFEQPDIKKSIVEVNTIKIAIDLIFFIWLFSIAANVLRLAAGEELEFLLPEPLPIL